MRRNGSGFLRRPVCPPAPNAFPVELARLPSRDRLRIRFGLTDREAEVAHLLALRWTGKEIARELDVRPSTANRHTESVLRKLGIHSRLEVYGVICTAFELHSKGWV